MGVKTHMPFRKSSPLLGQQPAFEASLPRGDPNNCADAGGAIAGEHEEVAGPRLSDMVRFYTNQELIASGEGKWKIHCPTVDHDDTRPSFEINDNLGHYGAFNCWGCLTHGGGETFAREIMGKESWQAAVAEYVAAKVNGRGTTGPVDVSRRRPATAASVGSIVNLRIRGQAASPPPISEEDYLYKMSIRHHLQKKIETASQLFQDSLLNDQIIDGMSKDPLNKKAKEYLASRGLWEPDPAFKVGYYPSASYVRYLDQKDIFRKNSVNVNASLFAEFSYLKDRIIIPWCDEGGEVVGLTGRSIGAPREGTPKYWNSRNTEVFKKSELLWGHHVAKDAIRKSGELLIVEGYTDVMSLHKAGIKQTVSPIGIAISRPQLDKIFRLNDHVLVCLDGDKAGRKASADVAKRTLAYLNETRLVNQGKSMSFALLPGGKDPDEILREGGVRAFREAISKRMTLNEMIAYGEALKRQETEKQVSGGLSGGSGTVTQNAQVPQRAALKRSVPDEQEQPRFEQKRQRFTGGLDL